LTYAFSEFENPPRVPHGAFGRSKQAKKSRGRVSILLREIENPTYREFRGFNMSSRVLIADDSSTMRKIIIRSLQAVGVSEVTEAADGTEAIAKFQPGLFDMVLTDWNMPGKSGLEVVQDIRGRDAKIPIIMVTTEAEKGRVMQAIQAGVSDYLVKPFTAETLREKLTKHGCS
jgi:two-component system chemotaxis response regulator CheY